MTSQFTQGKLNFIDARTTELMQKIPTFIDCDPQTNYPGLGFAAELSGHLYFMNQLVQSLMLERDASAQHIENILTNLIPS